MRSSFKFGLVLALVMLFLLPSSAFAAFEASDKTIKGTIEIYPENRPAAYANLQLVLEFTDSANKFKLKDCDCELQIAQPNKLPYKQKVEVRNPNAPDTNTTVIFYIFPSPATYTLTLTGKPINGASFEPFELIWDMPITGKPMETPKAKHPRVNWWLVGGAALAAVAFVFGVRYYRKKKKAKTDSKPTAKEKEEPKAS